MWGLFGEVVPPGDGLFSSAAFFILTTGVCRRSECELGLIALQKGPSQCREAAGDRHYPPGGFPFPIAYARCPCVRQLHLESVSLCRPSRRIRELVQS